MYNILAKASKLCEEGIDFALATIVDTDASTPQDIGSKMIVYKDGSIEGTVGGGPLEAFIISKAKECLPEGESILVELNLKPDEMGMMCGGRVKIFVEVIKKKINLLILGAGHIGEKIARTSEILNIPYSIADDREDFADKKRFERASKIICAGFDEVFNIANINKQTFIVIVTRCHTFDVDCLKYSLSTKARYIGMIGSKTKVKSVFKILNKEGLDPQKDSRVYSPIGLRLGSNDPAEIALSILSEILKITSQASAEHSRESIKEVYSF
ncbi:MAG TPA: xanthine dehydrogenase [Spirochaetes bacterium]|nr:xanthine dehydrogenase [Spirochaetota bacterium]